MSALLADDDQPDEERPGAIVAVPETSPAVPAGPAQDPAEPPKPGQVVYADITAAPGERRPIIPLSLRRDSVRSTVAVWSALQWHRSRYHGLRFPLYVLAMLVWAAVGVFRLAGRAIHWWWVLEQAGLRNDAVADGVAKEWLALHREAKQTRKVRGIVLACELGALLIAAVVTWRYAPPWAWLVLGAVTVCLLARAGRPDGVRIIGPAMVPPDYSPPTHAIIERALGALGIPEINKALKPDKDGRALGIRFISEVMRDGPGWSCHLDLPHGVSVSAILARREDLASGLRRPLSATWPAGVPEEHPGRLDLWVGIHDISKAKPAACPLVKARQTDLFGSLPFGTDPRGRNVGVGMFEVNFLIGASPGQGKALALDTPVPTPAGWVTMGELRDGDAVFGADGQPCTVARAWPVRYDRPCYEVEFSDGTVIVADADHLWLADTRASRISAAAAATPKHRESPYSSDQRHKRTYPQVVTTANMLGSLRCRDGRANYSVRVAAPLQAPAAPLPVPPYTLGAWLGDGTTSSGDITNPDHEVISAIEAEGETCTRVTAPSAEGKCPQYRIAGLRPRLRGIGVLGGKHIPVTYLRASEAQRRELLAGLLDTDGYCCPWGEVQFAVTCERLARDVHHLVASLGYKVGLRSKPARLYGKDCGTAWIVQFTPADKVFALPRKAARQVTKVRATYSHRYVTAIRPVPSVPVRCITVNSPDSLYLVGETCIPTHNTGAVRVLACGAALDPLADLWIHELAGKGDLDALGQVCHRYTSGLDDEAIGYAAESARLLRAETEKRAAMFRKLRGSGALPDGKVTRELAAKHRELRPLVAIFDEIQNLLTDKQHGKQAIEDLAYVIRVGRAYGIIAVLSTQRPDATIVPTSITGLIVSRFCLMVPDQPANDLVLGTTSYRRGYDATVFRPKVDAGLGWLKGGEEGTPQICRTYYLNIPAAEKIAARARVMRERAGALSGYALGEDIDQAVARDVLADVLAVLGTGNGMHWAPLADQLAERFPDRWADATAEAVSAQCRGAGVSSVDVKVDGTTLKGARRVLVERAISKR